MPNNEKINNYDQTFEMINVNRFEFEDNDVLEYDVKPRLEERDLETIRSSIVEGLGLQRIPDPSKVPFPSFLIFLTHIIADAEISRVLHLYDYYFSFFF